MPVRSEPCPRGTSHAWFVMAIAASGCVSACANPEARSVVFTEHLAIYTTDEADVCAGTAEVLERETLRVANSFGVSVDEEISVVLGPNVAEDFCDLGEPVAGCSGRDPDGRLGVAGSLDVVVHELVHAVRAAASLSGPSFYEEGIAEVLRSGELASYQIGSPGAAAERFDELQLAKVSTSADYIVAGNFVAWMKSSNAAGFVNAFADPQFLAVSSMEQLDSWFAESMGDDISDARDDWTATLPRSYYFAGPCEVNGAEPLTEQGVAREGVIDCLDDRSTLGPFWTGGPAELHSIASCVDVTGFTQLDIAFEGPSDAWLDLVSRDCGSSRPIPQEALRLHGGAGERVDVTGCTLQLAVHGSSLEPFEYGWSIQPAT